MKKLMFAVAAIAAGVAVADVESANIVGYTGKGSGNLNNFITVPFNAVGFNTCDINQIKISDGGMGTIGWGTEIFAVWEGLPSVIDGTGFAYYDPALSLTGATDYFWGDAEYNEAEFSFQPGQGVVVNCSADLQFTTSGQVPMETIKFTSVALNNFTGNPFPADISIQNIKISDGGMGTIGWGTEIFAVWEGLPTVIDGTGFAYYDPALSMTGATDYFWGDAEYNESTFKVAPGQGVVINCAEGLEISIEPPYDLSK